MKNWNQVTCSNNTSSYLWMKKVIEVSEMKKQAKTLALSGIVPTQKNLHLCMEHLEKHKRALTYGKNKRDKILPPNHNQNLYN